MELFAPYFFAHLYKNWRMNTIVIGRTCLSRTLLMKHQYTNDKLMVHHQQQHFLPSLHKKPTLSQLCHKLQKRTAVKMNLEQKENNDADIACTLTSRIIAQIRHYIAKEKKYGEWEAIDCSRTLIGK